MSESTLALIKQLGGVCNAAAGSSSSSTRGRQKAKRTTRGSSSTSNASPAGNNLQAGSLQAQPLPLMLQHTQQTQTQPMSLQGWHLEQAQQQQAVWVLPRQQQQQAGGAPPKAPEADTSLAALLLQCPPISSSYDDDAYNMHLLQLQGYATLHFGGLSLQEVPAALVVNNHMWSVQERAYMCLAAAASGAAGDGAAQASAGAACMAARQEVGALLRLAAQPVMVWLAEEWGWQEELGPMRTAADLLDAFCRSLAPSGSAAP